MLVAETLVKAFDGNRVVDNVSLRIAENEVVGLLGCNGAGKSTTFRMIIGMLQPDSGQVKFLGQDVTRSPMHERCGAGIGYLAQKTTVFTGLSVEQNLLAILEQLDLSRKDRRARCDALIDEFGLGRIRKSRAALISGGEKRRLELARALITEPKVILLDEPFAGVDPIKVAGIRAMITNLKDRGIAVLITDHNATQTLMATERAYIIHEGTVLASGTPAEVVADENCRRVYFGQDFTLDLTAPNQASPTEVAAEGTES